MVRTKLELLIHPYIEYDFFVPIKVQDVKSSWSLIQTSWLKTNRPNASRSQISNYRAVVTLFGDAGTLEDCLLVLPVSIGLMFSNMHINPHDRRRVIKLVVVRVDRTRLEVVVKWHLCGVRADPCG